MYIAPGIERLKQHVFHLSLPFTFLTLQHTPTTDMFWSAPWDADAQSDYCFARFGIHPRRTWAATMYGGRKALKTASNIVFSNGLLDPWSGTGVLEDVSESVVALTLKEGAHHLDLMFSTPDDPEELKEIRKTELMYIAQWIMEAGEAVKAGKKGESEDVQRRLRRQG